MHLHLGLYFGERLHPLPPVTGDTHYLAPDGVLSLLERQLGCSGYEEDNAALRIEQYRQVLQLDAAAHPEAFYQGAFQADPFATAAELLSRRDELMLMGWSFSGTALPDRLAALARLEDRLLRGEQHVLAPGFADRWVQLLDRLATYPHPVREVSLHDPVEHYPSHVTRLLEVLSARAQISEATPPAVTYPDTDLGRWQQRLIGTATGRVDPQGDNSLRIIRGAGSVDIADYVAQLLRNNRDFRPVCLVPPQRRTLDQACIQEGLASQGLLSASVARPSLQILKLVTAFLFDPIDPKKILEFVSLPLQPLDDRLSRVIAEQLAARPGIGGEEWRRALGRFWAQLSEAAEADATIKPGVIRGEYNRWFGRTRYPSGGRVPKHEVIELFAHVQEWAFQLYDESSSADYQAMSLMVLSSQARRVKELLMQVPENDLSRLELQRIVRTIYASSPVVQAPAERGHLAAVHEGGALLAPVDELLWWDFVEAEPNFFFSRWYQTERQYLADRQLQLDTPQQQNARLIYRRQRGVLRTRERLLLCIPDTVAGNTMQAHPLLGHLEATFGDLRPLTHDLRVRPVDETPTLGLSTCAYQDCAARLLAQPTPFLQLPPIEMPERERESFSSLDALFYYPHRWTLQHQAKLRTNDILSVVDEKRLKGNLAHKAFEHLFDCMDESDWTARRVEACLDERLPDLLREEGTPLLAYGKEPERVQFIKTLKAAATKLVYLLHQNGWTVEEAEMQTAGEFAQRPFTGIIDLVLRRGAERCIVDLKWSGLGYRRNLITNQEDLQLALYAHLLAQTTQGPVHTAYYIMDKAQLLTRSQAAFPKENALLPDADVSLIQQETLDKMLATYRWRLQQLREGRVEVRTKDTTPLLENTYVEAGVDLFPFLEMKQESSKFDPFSTLVQAFE